MSFVPGVEQRQTRELTRRNAQLNRELVRIQNQIESLLEPTRIKLSGVVSDVSGATGRRILQALSEGESDPDKLAALADHRTQCPLDRLVSALRGTITPASSVETVLQDAELAEAQKKELEAMTGEIMQQHTAPIQRLVHWNPAAKRRRHQRRDRSGRQSLRQRRPTKCVGRRLSGTRGKRGQVLQRTLRQRNFELRRALCEAAYAAVNTRNCRFQQKFKRLVPQLGYAKAIWAIVRLLCVVIWNILHQRAAYIEHGGQTELGAIRRRAQRLHRQLSAAGLSMIIVPLTTQTQLVSTSISG